MAQPGIEPITDATLPEFARFLQQNMPVTRSAADWEAGLRCQWMVDRPNFGFMLRADDGAVVGGIGAYYADRVIRGRAEKFCNITSWCVLDAYRKLSMKLAMSVISQPGYNFTDFSPTKVVGGTLKFFKFKELDEREAAVLNLPWPALGPVRVLHSRESIESALQGQALTIYRDHLVFPWLRHLVLGTPGHWCHVIYKRVTFKGLPAARLLYIGDRQVFARHFRHLGSFLLLRGMASTHVECRMVDHWPAPSRIREGFNRKVFLSRTLEEPDIDYLYSEQMVLDL